MAKALRWVLVVVMAGSVGYSLWRKFGQKQPAPPVPTKPTKPTKPEKDVEPMKAPDPVVTEEPAVVPIIPIEPMGAIADGGDIA